MIFSGFRELSEDFTDVLGERLGNLEESQKEYSRGSSGAFQGSQIVSRRFQRCIRGLRVGFRGFPGSLQGRFEGFKALSGGFRIV